MHRTLKEKIKSILQRYGHNQNDLAELLGITYQSVSLKMNEKNDFTYREIYRIAQVYKLTPDELYDVFFSLENKL